MTSNHPNDSDLRRRFAELRDEISASAPPFDPPSTRRSGKRIARWIPATAGLVTAATALAVITINLRDAPAAYDLGLGSVVWSAPTDFLLEIPGSSLLRGMPRIGVDISVSTVTEADRSQTTR